MIQVTEPVLLKSKVLSYDRRMNLHRLLIFVLALAAVSCVHRGEIGEGSSAASDAGSPLLAFYRGPLNHLSAVRSGSCPMYPSCSEYSRQAIGKHGHTLGWLMTVDRLLRCGRDETRLAPKIRIDGQLKTFDPLENNDFWQLRAGGAGTGAPATSLP